MKKEGYQTIQTALQVKIGKVLDQKIKLESLAVGIMVVSDPPGADVFVDGIKQAGHTPMSLPLAPGQYNMVLHLEGYARYSGGVQVQDNIQTQFKVQLRAKDEGKVAWANVTSTPPALKSSWTEPPPPNLRPHACNCPPGYTLSR